MNMPAKKMSTKIIITLPDRDIPFADYGTTNVAEVFKQMDTEIKEGSIDEFLSGFDDGELEIETEISEV